MLDAPQPPECAVLLLIYEPLWLSKKNGQVPENTRPDGSGENNDDSSSGEGPCLATPELYTAAPGMSVSDITSSPDQVQAAVLGLLLDRMPARPLAGDSVQAAARQRMRPEHALEQRYCQYNPRARLGILSLDLDQQDAWSSIADAALLQGVRLPPPNAETVRRGGNQQAHWLLADPVGRSAAHRQEPQQLLAAVRRQLCHAYQADPASSGHLMRGLLHRDQTTRYYHPELHRLTDLQACLPAVPRQAQPHGGDGRNAQVFRALDTLAAQLVAQGAVPGADVIRTTLETEGRRLLAELPAGSHPYTPAELRRTIASVLRRTQRGDNARYVRLHGVYVPSVPGAALRCRQRSWEREAPLAPEVARAHMLAALEVGNGRRQAAAVAPLLAAARRLASRGDDVTTRAMQTELLTVGVTLSERNIKRHAATWRAEAQRSAQEGHQTPAQQAAD
jgi:Replicase family